MLLYELFLQHPHICTDNRKASSNSIFFALKGEKFNANAFALTALEGGCNYAVVDEAEYAIDERFVLVNNVLETLQQLALYHRQQLQTPIIGITGTNGKTTTKELIAAVLKEKYNVHYTQGNLNNHIGVPLTLLQLKPEHEIAVVEMGASHQGEIKTLCEIACPDYGIITNIGKAHLEGFGSFAGIKQTKAELYDYIAKSGKCVFINPKNKDLREIAGNISLENKLEKYIDGEVISSSPFLEIKISFPSSQEKEITVKSNLIGSYNAENILAAATIGRYFSLSTEQIKQGLENYVPQNNRSQFVKTKNNCLIVDAYNANPTSMQAAVSNFSEITATGKTLILGDMLELGTQSQEEHQAIVNLIKEKKFENVYLIGTEFAKTKQSFHTFANVDDLIAHFDRQALKDSYVLIKGSRGVQLEKILSYL